MCAESAYSEIDGGEAATAPPCQWGKPTIKVLLGSNPGIGLVSLISLFLAVYLSFWLAT